MKSHYCHEEKAIIEFTGQCNWCGEKEINANELADELDKSRQEPFTSEYLVGQAATMLRQLQAENEALKAKALTDEEILDVEKRLRNNGDFCELNFARALLIKAQEK